MDVGEEVVVGEVVIGDRIVRDEVASSRAERSLKTLSPFSRTGLKRCGFEGLLSRPAVHAASRDEGECSSAVLRILWREEEEILVRLSERSYLPFIGVAFKLHYRTRSAWQKFRHRLGSFLQPASRRDEAWRGEAGGRGGARVDISLVLMLVQVGKEPPL